MATFWRVQNAVGKGPYSCYGSWCKRSHEGPKHPSITEYDLPPDISVNDHCNVCGFLTEQQAAKWFCKSELRRLESLGFTLQKVQGELIFADRYQAFFKRQP